MKNSAAGRSNRSSTMRVGRGCVSRCRRTGRPSTGRARRSSTVDSHGGDQSAPERVLDRLRKDRRRSSLDATEADLVQAKRSGFLRVRFDPEHRRHRGAPHGQRRQGFAHDRRTGAASRTPCSGSAASPLIRCASRRVSAPTRCTFASAFGADPMHFANSSTARPAEQPGSHRRRASKGPGRATVADPRHRGRRRRCATPCSRSTSPASDAVPRHPRPQRRRLPRHRCGPHDVHPHDHRTRLAHRRDHVRGRHPQRRRRRRGRHRRRARTRVRRGARQVHADRQPLASAATTTATSSRR